MLVGSATIQGDLALFSRWSAETVNLALKLASVHVCRQLQEIQIIYVHMSLKVLVTRFVECPQTVRSVTMCSHFPHVFFQSSDVSLAHIYSNLIR